MMSFSDIISEPTILLLGCGTVGKCFLACAKTVTKSSNFKFNPKKLTIIDQVDVSCAEGVKPILADGAIFMKKCITKENLVSVLNEVFVVQQTDEDQHSPKVIIDLTVGISCISILDWCKKNHVNYINTALELWEDDIHLHGDWLKELTATGSTSRMVERSLRARQLHVRSLFPAPAPLATSSLEDVKGQGFTAILDHGMNPGLVSHFTKVGLEKIAEKVTQKSSHNLTDSHDLKDALESKNHAQLAYLLGLRTIHISERDTQIPTKEAAKKPGEFLCTWSPAGFHEEGLDPVQVGWGTHERRRPTDSIPGAMSDSESSKNPVQIMLQKRGVHVWMKSFVPGFGPIEGMNIPHSEASTIAEYLSLGNGVYRPTVHYVYDAPNCAKASWAEIFSVSEDLEIQDSVRGLKGFELESGGADAVGVLLMFETDPFEYYSQNRSSAGTVPSNTKPWCYWAGTILDVDTVRKQLGSLPAPTTVQVVASLVGSLSWLFEDDHGLGETRGHGVVWPENLPSDKVLEVAAPWLGNVFFGHVDWSAAPAGCQFIDMCISK